VKHNHENGKIECSKKSLSIYTNDGCIEILELQIPGKKKMDIQSFLNGIDSSSYIKAR